MSQKTFDDYYIVEALSKVYFGKDHRGGSSGFLKTFDSYDEFLKHFNKQYGQQSWLDLKYFK